MSHTDNVKSVERKKILEVRELRKFFDVHKGMFKRQVGSVRAVNDVSLSVYEGETLGLVGESGSGKTTLGRCVVRALEPTSGEIMFQLEDGTIIDLASLTAKELRPYRRHFQMIFQDPYSSLNPRRSVLETIREPIMHNKIASGEKAVDMVKEMLDLVGLAQSHLNRYPHAFSGGQRQRIGIARALVTSPRLIICDEPVSALDVSVQAQILNLLIDLQKAKNLSYVFIAHDLSVVEYIADRVAVMYLGNVVELSETGKLFARPLHPYTQALLSNAPTIDRGTKKKRVLLRGEVPNPSSPPSGCVFHPRCDYATELCKTTVPNWEELEEGRFVACHYASKLRLDGIKLENNAVSY